MESDSLNTNDSTFAADSAALDTGALTMPTPEQLGISINAGNGAKSMSAMVGDTFDFPVTVSWSVNGSSLLVLPTNSATAKGLEQVGISQESARTVKDGKEIASITFNYRILAQDTGNLNVPVLKYEIPTNMGQPLTLRTESVPVRVDAPMSVWPFIVGVIVAIAVVTAGILRARRRAKARATAEAKATTENELRDQMMTLKQRVNTADSRAWLLELECICQKYAPEGLKKADDKDGWGTLLQEFAHARYGGGMRDSFQNLETWKLAMLLLKVKEED